MKFEFWSKLLLFTTIFAFAAIGCKKKVHVQCSDSPKSVRMNTEQAFIAVCPANCASAFGSVWGSGPYTTDSSICRAAIHGGAIKDTEGGGVTVKLRPGQGSYSATVANGVASGSWGAYDSGFDVK